MIMDKKLLSKASLATGFSRLLSLSADLGSICSSSSTLASVISVKTISLIELKWITHLGSVNNHDCKQSMMLKMGYLVPSVINWPKCELFEFFELSIRHQENMESGSLKREGVH